MKQFFRYSVLAAMAFIGVACAKEETRIDDSVPSAVQPFHLTVDAGDPATKTVVGEDGSTFSVQWQAGDQLGVYEVGNGVVQPFAQSDPLTGPSATASFGLSLPGAVEAPYDYTFVYPASALTKTGEQYFVTLPRTQTFPAGSFDIGADVLVSEHLHYATERPTSLNAQFARLGGIGRMVIQAPATAEQVERITLSTPEGNLAGAFSLNPATGELSDAVVSGGSSSLLLTPAASTTYTGSIVVWFRVAAISLSQEFTVSVRTHAKTYTKTVDLATASRTLAFENGTLSKFSVNMTEVVGVENPYDGNYAEITSSDVYAQGITSNTYKDMPQFEKANGDKWAGKVSYSAGSFALNDTEGNYLQLPTFDEEIAQVVITVSSISGTRSLFLTDSASGVIGSAYKSVSASDAGEYVLDVSDQHLHTACLRVTTGAVMMSKVAVVAKNDSRTALAAPAEVTAVKDAKVNNTVNLSWSASENAAAYLVTYTPEGGSASTVKVTDESVSLESLNYSTTYTYSVTALADLYYSKHSTATVGVAFTTGAQPEGLKVDVITVDNTAATGNSYADFSDLARNSTARYAGKNAKGNGAIQLNNSNPYGIWTTTSGGHVRSVTLTLTANGTNTVDVYAKNGAYESGDLYGTNAKQGTKVGSVTATGTDVVKQKISFSADYTHIGIRSYSGAVYVSEIRIEWADAAAPAATVTTADATDVEAVNATLNGSYSGATNGILEAGFYWDTDYTSLNNLAHPDQFVVASDSDVATAKSFSCVLPSLSENTRYYFKAYVVEFDSSTQSYVEHYGSILNFQTLSKESFTPGGWLEMPSYTVEAMAGTTTSALNDLYTVTHYATMGGQRARNYSILYDPAMYASYWVAYPLCAAHMGDGRVEDWGYDPIVPQAKQTAVFKGYGVNVASDKYSNQHYARGHQLPNADRNGVDAMMAQTYYSTNMTPQLQHGFNGGVWVHLEDAVRSSVTAGTVDTVYVVTGAAFRKKGGNETIKTITSTRDGKVLPVPNYYWKALLKVKWTGDQVSAATSIGFWLEHRDNYDNGGTNYLPYVVSVDQIEEWTGFDFFTNLATQFQTTAEAATDWAAFKSF